MKVIESIQANTYKKIYIVVVVDGNSWLYMRLRQIATDLRWRDILITLNDKRMDWVYSQNQALKKYDSDYYICSSDDFTFPPDSIKRGMERMKKRFPDSDGVVSLWRRNNPIVGIFGRKWVERFPDRKMFCPDYTHYCGDGECGQAAKMLGRLANTGGQRVRHNSRKDETRSLSQKARRRDADLLIEREKMGYKWGVNFNLVGEQ